jgi:flagellar basal-body rod modification protein FlgD
MQMVQAAGPTASRANAASSSSAGATSGSAASSSTASTTNPGLDLTNTFLQLLTVQLQNQSPLDPLDPNAFITQLAQFDSLGELTQIQQSMQTLVNDVTATSGSTADAVKSAYSSTNTIPNSVSN